MLTMVGNCFAVFEVYGEFIVRKWMWRREKIFLCHRDMHPGDMGSWSSVVTYEAQDLNLPREGQIFGPAHC
ncbi:hypothetical protein AA0228_0449 [Gluconobacter frateurii NRIC 0228]|uniref:Uncharacterized protein n=1 Tax=Gluconobacter frateurii NRIC 0228 TaxID=1307946 RepID=A0ABQ0Q8A9_9PROT|nr:hypothetical protein AA0228_0449 [Gluconobacter frateurii NRIC 0228]